MAPRYISLAYLNYKVLPVTYRDLPLFFFDIVAIATNGKPLLKRSFSHFPQFPNSNICQDLDKELAPMQEDPVIKNHGRIKPENGTRFIPDHAIS